MKVGCETTTAERTARALKDLVASLRGWRLWTTLGSNDIGQRYRRSRIGQFWITLSMAVFILSIGSVYALLFRADLRQHLLHVVVYYIVWSFLSASVIECSTAFIDAERYLRQEALPKLAFVFRVVWRNAFAFLHNLVLVPAAILALRAPIAPTMAYALAGMLVLIVNLTLFGVIVAVVCTRFRDLRQIIQSGAQLAFFTSPVMWKAEALPLDAAWIVEFSPVAQHLRLACDPLLGLTPTVEDFTGPLLSTAFLVLIATPLFVRLRERLVYWL